MTSLANAIWIFAGGPRQKPLCERIMKLGYKLILTDINPNCICRKISDEFICLDTFDISGNIERAHLLKSKYKICAVLTAAADCHYTVSKIAQELNLHGISPEISNACRQKHITREILTKAGIRQPRYTFAENLVDAKKFLSSIGGSGVIKATDNSGSRGFKKINDISELNEQVFNYSVESGTTGGALLEEALLSNPDCISELSVETLWYDGEMFWLNWVDRLFARDIIFFKNLKKLNNEKINFGVEIGHINPAQHHFDIKKKVRRLIFDSGVALGMLNEKGGHILKADVILTPDGPVIIELTPRLSGGWDSSASSILRGGDFLSGVIHMALGKEIDLTHWHQFFEYKDPGLNVSVLANIAPNATDCVGRQFFLGASYNRDKSIDIAYEKLTKGKYVI